MARWLIIAGLILVIAGLALSFAPGLFNWFGRLPGDIRIEGERGRFYLPITSMLVVSVVLTLLINLFLCSKPVDPDEIAARLQP